MPNFKNKKRQLLFLTSCLLPIFLFFFNMFFFNIVHADNAQDLSNFTKPTTETITVTQAEVTSRDQNTLNKFLNEDGKLKVGDVTFTFNANERKATITATPLSTKAQGSVEFTAVTVEKPALNTLTKTTTQAITVTQEETTTPTQDTLNKFLQTAGSLTVNTDATIEFDTTNNKATITATPNLLKHKVVFFLTIKQLLLHKKKLQLQLKTL
ncbi:MAG: putative secreted protein [Candidatus Phytoplasma solani]